MKTDLEKIIRSKQAFREKLSRKPIAEKLQILEQMAERARWIQKHQDGASNPAQTPGSRTDRNF